MLKPGQQIRIIKDTCGDLPKSLIMRKGTIIRRRPDHDEFPAGNRIKAYNVQVKSRKKPILLYEDEMDACFYMKREGE